MRNFSPTPFRDCSTMMWSIAIQSIGKFVTCHWLPTLYVFFFFLRIIVYLRINDWFFQNKLLMIISEQIKKNNKFSWRKYSHFCRLSCPLTLQKICLLMLTGICHSLYYIEFEINIVGVIHVCITTVLFFFLSHNICARLLLHVCLYGKFYNFI